MANSEDNTKIVSILSYICFVGIIWYFADNKVQNNMTKHHVKQALNLFIIAIGFSFVTSSLMTMFMFSGLFFLAPIFGLINLAILVLWVFGLIFAINQEKKEIPLIGQFAEKYLTF
jgi:uncharacterized membrane protein